MKRLLKIFAIYCPLSLLDLLGLHYGINYAIAHNNPRLMGYLVYGWLGSFLLILIITAVAVDIWDKPNET